MLAIQTVLNPLKNAFNPLLIQTKASFLSLENYEDQKESIKKIAIDSLKELAISLSFTSVTCLFVATSAIPTMLALAIGTVALNTILRTTRLYMELKLSNEPFNPESQELIISALFLKRLVPFIIFSLLDLTTRGLLTHEAGHAFAALALFQNAKPSIEILPFSGVTKMSFQSLSKLGNFFGRRNSELLVSAAGPLVGTLLAMSDLSVAHVVKDSNPELNTQLKMSAICNVAGSALYALSALWDRTSGHDFVHLWKIGQIHPIASVVCIIAVPILYQGCLSAFSS